MTTQQDLQDEIDALRVQAEQSFIEETREAFEKMYAGKLGNGVDFVAYSAVGRRRLDVQSTIDAFMEELDYDRAELREVLKYSNCPLVAALKAAVTESYIKRNMDVAELRAKQ